MKILVIADDLSGATELAGIAWRNRHRVQISSDISTLGECDITCLNTNTRAMSEAAAIEVIKSILVDGHLDNVDIIF